MTCFCRSGFCVRCQTWARGMCVAEMRAPVSFAGLCVPVSVKATHRFRVVLPSSPCRTRRASLKIQILFIDPIRIAFLLFQTPVWPLDIAASVWIHKQAAKRAPIMHPPFSFSSLFQPSILPRLAMEYEKTSLCLERGVFANIRIILDEKCPQFFRSNPSSVPYIFCRPCDH